MIALRRRGRGRARAVAADALHRHRQGDPRGRQGEARRRAVRHRRRAHLCHDFGLGTACLAIAACLLLPTYYVNPHAGNAFVLVAFTIVVLGGMGSVAGALVGGLIIGVVESLSRPLSRRIARPDRHLRDLHPRAAVPPERPVRRARMKGYAPHRRSRSRCWRCVPLLTASNVVLNFMVVALLIALVGQGWNVLGGYGGQYSFGHAAFFGTGAYVDGDPAGALRRQRVARPRHRHRGRRAGRRGHRRAQLPLRPAAARTSRWSRSPSPKCCASSRASRRSPAPASAR